MLVAKHPDGRVLLVAAETCLPPMVKRSDGKWSLEEKLDGDVDRFKAVVDRTERLKILSSAHMALLGLDP